MTLERFIWDYTELGIELNRHTRIETNRGVTEWIFENGSQEPNQMYQETESNIKRKPDCVLQIYLNYNKNICFEVCAIQLDKLF